MAKDEADRIIDELLARDGAMSREALRVLALEAMRDAGEPMDPPDSQFLKHQMIVLAAKDDAEYMRKLKI